MFARTPSLPRVRPGIRRRATGSARPQERYRSAFTFIEILVVMIILALIAGIVGTQLIGEAEKAKADSTRIQIRALTSSLDLYRLHNSTYPTTEQGLRALVLRPEVGTIPPNWQGPYLTSKTLPADGWGREFLYQSDGRAYTIRSLGADGQEGGSDLDADLSSDQL
jgi:general secretion pathway protein G